MTATKALRVVHSSSGEVVRRIEVSNPSERKVETIIMGLMRNMNNEEYHVDDCEFDGMFDGK